MLDRNRLAKQFELVVQQEIKNHNDQMLATNLAINSLKENMEMQSKYFSSVFVELIEKSKTHEEANLLIAKKLDNIEKALLSEKKCREKLQQINEEKFNVVADELLNLDKKLQAKMDAVSVFFEKLAWLEGLIKKNEGLTISALETYDYKIKKYMIDFRKEIESRPSEVLGFQKEFKNDMSTHTVRVNGVLDELQHYKKDVYVIEKKIENIYILIQRLQAGKT